MDRLRPQPKQMPTRRASVALVVLGMIVTPGCYGAGSATVSPPLRSTLAPSRAPVVISRTDPAPVEAAQEAAPTTLPKAIEALPVAWQTDATPRDWQYIVLHHTATGGGSVESIDAVHRRRKDSQGHSWLGIGYHFVIGNGQGMPDGQVESTFRWRDQIHGAHSGVSRYNDWGIGICLVGDFEKTPPTAKQTLAARRLVTALRRRFEISSGDVRRHGDLVATECPGTLFSVADVLGDGAVRDTSTAARMPVRTSRATVRQPFF